MESNSNDAPTIEKQMILSYVRFGANDPQESSPVKCHLAEVRASYLPSITLHVFFGNAKGAAVTPLLLAHIILVFRDELEAELPRKLQRASVV